MAETKANRLEVIQVRQDNPCATLQQLGDKFGITRERVRQILKRASVPPKPRGRTPIPKGFCLQCGAPVYHKNAKCCSLACSKAYHKVPLECPTCKQIFYRTVGVVLDRLTRGWKHIYCSMDCFCIARKEGSIYRTSKVRQSRIDLIYAAFQEFMADFLRDHISKDDIKKWLKERKAKKSSELVEL